MSNQPKRGNLFVVAAPSGGGKTSLINKLLQHDQGLSLSVSHTTRPVRPGEVNGQHYHFVSEEEFLQLVDADVFIEHARVFDHLYGTSHEAITSQLEQGLDIMLDIDWQGARQVRARFPGSCLIFIIPPSLEALSERLRKRAQDSANVIQRRMRDAQAEISHWAEFDQVVVNDKFEDALEDLLNIINDHREGKPRQANKHNQRLAEQLGSR